MADTFRMRLLPALLPALLASLAASGCGAPPVKPVRPLLTTPSDYAAPSITANTTTTPTTSATPSSTLPSRYAAVKAKGTLDAIAKTRPAPAARPTTTRARSTTYRNCAATRGAGAAPIHAGEPGYARHLDRDGDGTGCE